MDLYTFISNIISSLVWPVFFLIFILVFRTPILGILQNLKKLEIKGVKFDFSEKIQEVMEEATGKLPESNIRAIEEVKDLTKLAEYTPRGAILEAWLKVESALSNAGKRHKYTDENVAPHTFLSYVIHGLKSKKLISNEIYELFNKLKKLRNEAVHIQESSITKESAIDYAILSSKLVENLERL